jgi:glucose/arabinose dehydrogenase
MWIGSALVVSAALGVATQIQAQCNTPLIAERVVGGLSSPLYVTAPPGDTGRLFIVEQGGAIKIYDLASEQLLPTPFITVTVTFGGERGLLGLAFDPFYSTNGYFYVNYTLSVSGQLTSFVTRYQVSADPNIADPNSKLDVLSVAQPYSNHNGGWISFGPDNYLYISFGDGGSGGDPENRAQNINVWLGKMLRIDVSNSSLENPYDVPADNPFVGVDGADEIWAYGLRNAWRNAFDRKTGDLWIADVGQGNWEEVNFQPAASAGGENYGWRCYEGNHPYNTNGCPPAEDLVFPIYEYSHGSGCSVTGGYVYRGAALKDLRGVYFFSDYCSEKIWSFRYVNGQVIEFADRTADLDPPTYSVDSIVSYGEDANGELYIVDGGGEVFRIAADGTLKGDLNRDNSVDFGDVNALVLAISDAEGYRLLYGDSPVPAGDLNCDGEVNFGDINLFVQLLTS